MDKVRAHVIISGLVQGVLFRAYTKDEAEKRSLAGWVKNRWDGRVEAVFEGRKDDIDRMVNWLYKGPPHAQVREVEVSWEDPTGNFDTFSVKY